MCQKPSRLTYSPRRLVAFAEGGSGGGGAGAGGDGGGQGANPPQRPAPRPGGPSPATAWSNWKQPMPLGRKIRLGVRNTGIKIRTGKPCCGNYGEPGC